MISPADIQQTRVDLTLFSTVLVISNLVSYQLQKTDLFNEKWKNLAIAILIGVALHGLLTNKVSSEINKCLNVENEGVRKSVYDLIRFGTIFVSQKVITSYIEDKEIVFDNNWVMTFSLTMGGFTAFNMLEPYIPKICIYQPLLNDLIKVSMGTLTANYFMDGSIKQSHLLNLMFTLSGLGVFHLVTKQYVVPKEKFSTQCVFSTMSN
jgi:hypothetical protein